MVREKESGPRLTSLCGSLPGFAKKNGKGLQTRNDLTSELLFEKALLRKGREY